MRKFPRPIQPRRTAPARLAFSLGCVLAAGGAGAQQGRPRRTAPAPTPALPAAAHTAAAAGYVGSRACATCHQDLYDRYRQTPMGESLQPAAQAAPLRALTAPVRIYAARLQRYFVVERRGGEYFQLEYAVAADGTRLFTVERQLAYAIGSDLQGVSFLVRSGNALFQAPLVLLPAGAWLGPLTRL